MEKREKQHGAAKQQLDLDDRMVSMPHPLGHSTPLRPSFCFLMSSQKQNDNKLSLTLFWTKVDADDATNRMYKCKLCGVSRKLNKSGYINTVDHLNEKHPKWREVLERVRSKKSVKGAMDAFLQPQVDSKYSIKIYSAGCNG